MSAAGAPRVHLLACGVLAADLRVLAQRAPVHLDLEFLPGKLHETPAELHRRLQERIDAVSAAGAVERIAIAYGLCGRGTIGLQARGLPLLLPRVHDCIALFLGSDARYREEFARYPGTYYVSAGWAQEGMGCGPGAGERERADWSLRHGPENAAAIADFVGGWRRNYQRAAFIDTGIGDTHHARLAEDLAAANGWRYESLAGSHDLLRALVEGADTPQVLHVPPGFVTAFDAAARQLVARPPAGRPAAPAAAPAPAARPPAAAARRAGLGLGIDAGGTYTDAVLFDWAAQRPVAKAKAPTTHWDYAIGIEQALDHLPADRLGEVTRVCVSTTLATNAIVEGKGQRVGLLLMPPAGDDDAARLRHRPVARLRGRLSIDGQELEPVDLDEAACVARELVAREGVKAFAVTGYASHVNPQHELAVMAAVRAATGLPGTCGHEVSSILNYRVRAETAALNARIIPCLEALMSRLRDCLRRRDVRAPLMVVRSDGSLMNLETALDRPVETLLSGPAASVAGARHLCHTPEALVIDMGGTTSDTAVLHGGVARSDPDGATVGHWRTHVRALAVRTLGLGGDSEVRLDRHGLHVGPQRVTPVCRLFELCPPDAARACLDRLAAQRQDAGGASESCALYARQPGLDAGAVTARQAQVLELLAAGPRSVLELVQATGCLRPAFLDLHALQERQVLRRFAFTPTDALHVLGRMARWDRDLAVRLAARLADGLGLGPEAFAERVVEEVVRRAARELLLTRLADLDGPVPVEADHGAVAHALVERALGARPDALGVRLSLGVPLVGIGAPAAFFLPAAAERLGAEALLPVDGDVANAIGAIAGEVRVERSARVHVDERGIYRVHGVAGAPAFPTLQAAQACAEATLREQVGELARRAGAAAPVIAVTIDDRITRTADGMELFVARVVTACATGEPAS